jgi:hypothetical protein
MARSVPFRLNRGGVLLALVSAALAGQAAASTAGRVDFAFGGATLTGPSGQQRPLARGTEVNSGDVIHTNNGRVQMRMKDGSYISLQPNTEFGIKNYNFEGKTDGTESAFYSLLKGAMRTVTGLIGRVNRNRYQVATPTATVGIRGTGGLIQILNDGGTLVQGTSGIWFLANPAGSIDVPAGVSGLAPADPTQPPKETAEIPTSGPAPLPPAEEFVQGDTRESDGTSVITVSTTPVLASGSGFTAALAFSSSGSPDLTTMIDVPATFNSTGQLIEIPNGSFNVFALNAGGSHADFGTDGILAWGRWIGSVTGDDCGDGCTFTETYSANQGLHYVIGIPTARLPLVGGGIYNLLGATRPTYVDGSTAPGVFSGQMTVTFGGVASIDANFTVTMPDRTYTMDVTGVATSSAQFGFSPTVGGCQSGCNANVQGFFAGTNAERAGIAYEINDLKSVVGAAAFAKK